MKDNNTKDVSIVEYIITHNLTICMEKIRVGIMSRECKTQIETLER